MKKLLKDYEFNAVEDYYQYILDSFFNGQSNQVKDLFAAMPTKNKVYFVWWVHEPENGLPKSDRPALSYLINSTFK